MRYATKTYRTPFGITDTESQYVSQWEVLKWQFRYEHERKLRSGESVGMKFGDTAFVEIENDNGNKLGEWVTEITSYDEG